MEEDYVWGKDAENSNFGHGEFEGFYPCGAVEEEIGFMGLEFNRHLCTRNVDLEVISLNRVVEDSYNCVDQFSDSQTVQFFFFNEIE